MQKKSIDTFEEFKKLMNLQAKGYKLANDHMKKKQKARSELSMDYLNMCRKKEREANRPLTQEEKIGVWKDNFRRQSQEILENSQTKAKEIFKKYKLW